MNLKHLSRDELLSETRRRVSAEKDATLALLECLRELDGRKTYLEMGFASLHEFVIQDLGLSEGSAHRRISAARLLAQIPELKPALEEGKLNLSSLTMAQSAFRKSSYSISEKKEILKELESAPKREVERKLSALCPESPKPDQVRAISATHSELKLTVSEEMLRKLDRLRELLAHTHSQASVSELLELALDRTLAKLDPANQPSASPPPVKATKNVRYIPSRLKLFVWKRALGKCEFVSAHGGKRCGSRFALQYDHLLPVAHGGQTTEGNLRLLCAGHNSSEARRILGAETVDRYRSGV